MDLDAHTRRAQELAVTLGARKPRVKRGKLSEELLPDGILVRTLVFRPYITLTPPFDNFSEPERDSELAQAVVISDLTESGMPKFVGIATVVCLALGGLTGIAAAALDVPEGLGVNLVFALFIALWTCLYLACAFVWSRRIIFQADRKVAEVLGVPWVTTSVQLSRQMRHKRRGVFGLYLGLSMPNEERRLEAIADLTAERAAEH
ncbi:hypothetical protein [Nocardia sp. NPDC060259]|uniref:hypothetical protein n=1 Tax=Nocardia sp. NPDC060259 TaxID=3347088 RepID=UPI0036681B8A